MRDSTKPFDYIMSSRMNQMGNAPCMSTFQNFQGSSISTNHCATSNLIDLDTFLKHSPYADEQKGYMLNDDINVSRPVFPEILDRQTPYAECGRSDLMQTTKLKRTEFPDFSLRHDNPASGIPRSMYMNVGRDTQQEAKDNYRSKLRGAMI